jgi:hypothetical protein
MGINIGELRRQSPVPTSDSTHETFLGLDRFLLQRFGSPIHHLVKIAPEGHAPPFPAADLENTGGDPPQCGKWASGRAEAASACGNVHLNSAVGYITPKDILAGRQPEIHADRDRKLEAAKQQRQIRRQAAA